jgi:hypothetical protein
MIASRVTTTHLIALGVAVMVIIVSAEFSAEFQVNFAVPHPQPSQSGLSELMWIREHFGFDNQHIIIVVRDPTSYLWALAYDGGLIYFGNVLYLLANQTDYGLLNNPDPQIRSDYIGSWQRLWVYGVLQRINSGIYEVIVPSDLYKPDVLEMQSLIAVGEGLLQTRTMDSANISTLLEAWNLARTTNDFIGPSTPYLNINPLADCGAYSSWASTTSATSVRLAQNFTNASACSLHITTQEPEGATTYVTLNGTWNLATIAYFGFYFKGTANSSSAHSLNILLSSTADYSSYYYYEATDESLWGGSVNGVVLNLTQFQTKGFPDLSSISSIRFGTYSIDNTRFDYSLQYLMTATER